MQAPISVYTSGKGSSAAGLTATVVRDNSGEFFLEVCCSVVISNKCLHFPAHVLVVCGPSPIPPGWLVLSVTIRTIDVQHAKIRSNNVVPYLPRPRGFGPLT